MSYSSAIFLTSLLSLIFLKIRGTDNSLFDKTIHSPELSPRFICAFSYKFLARTMLIQFDNSHALSLYNQS